MAETDLQTPPTLLRLVRSVAPTGEIALDPATSADNPVGAALFYALPERDGLTLPWLGFTFVNPPYSLQESPRWARKIAAEAAHGRAEIVALLPARVDTRWWHDHIAPADAVCFLRGRPRFIRPGADGPLPGPGKFASAVAYFGDRAKVFRRVFEPHGWVVS